MKKLAIVGLVFLTLLTGCKTKEERELERLREESERAQQAAADAARDLYELQQDIDRLKALQDAVNNAR